MMRDPLWFLTRRYCLPDVRAGWHDARRTPGARPWPGRRLGLADYHAGYAVGAVVSLKGERS